MIEIIYCSDEILFVKNDTRKYVRQIINHK